MDRTEYRQRLRRVKRQLRSKGLPECLAGYWRPGEFTVREYTGNELRDVRCGFIAACARVVDYTDKHHLSRFNFAEVLGVPSVVNGVCWDLGKWAAYTSSIGYRLASGETVAV